MSFVHCFLIKNVIIMLGYRTVRDIIGIIRDYQAWRLKSLLLDKGAGGDMEGQRVIDTGGEYGSGLLV